jgi:hypothetical protein
MSYVLTSICIQVTHKLILQENTVANLNYIFITHLVYNMYIYIYDKGERYSIKENI